MPIKNLKELKQKAARILSYMDGYYGCEIMYGRITLTRNLLSELYKKDIPLSEKIQLTQKLIDMTAYTKNKKFKLK